MICATLVFEDFDYITHDCIYSSYDKYIVDAFLLNMFLMQVNNNFLSVGNANKEINVSSVMLPVASK